MTFLTYKREFEFLPIIFIVGIYIFIKLPDILAIDTFVTLVLPLNLFHYANTLMDGFNVNSALNGTVIAPANASLIYPPGISILSKLLGTVRNEFYFLFLIQLSVPITIYFLIRNFAPRLYAFSIAILIAHYCTIAKVWYPDYIIQPLMAIVVLWLLTDVNKPSCYRLLIIGVLSGLIILVKHNVGIFFSILCVTILIIQSFDFSESDNKPEPLGYIILSGFFLFGIVFGSRLLYFDEIIFYLLPYFIFWSVVVIKYRAGIFVINVNSILKNSALYLIATLFLPVIVFMWFGSEIGYKNYWYSLFGMGFDHLQFWDKGIVGIFRSYLNPEGRWSGSALFNLAAIAGPFFVNVLSVSLYIFMKPTDNNKQSQQMITISIGLMAIFMLFPLEDHKIAVTKIFIFIYVATFILKQLPTKVWKKLVLVPVVVLPVVAFSAERNIRAISQIETEIGTPEINKIIGMKIHKNIASELSNQLLVLNRTVKNKKFYILASPSSNIMTLSVFVNNQITQLYVRFDEVALNEKVVNEMEKIINQMDYLVVSVNDYMNNNHLEDKKYIKLIDKVKTSFVIVDEYHSKIEHKTISTKHIDDFYVLKKI